MGRMDPDELTMDRKAREFTSNLTLTEPKGRAPQRTAAVLSTEHVQRHSDKFLELQQRSMNGTLTTVGMVGHEET